MNSILGPAMGGITGLFCRKYLAGNSQEFKFQRYDVVG
jgi:hypothetical protein